LLSFNANFVGWQRGLKPLVLDSVCGVAQMPPDSPRVSRRRYDWTE